jgi:hypothetical protein
MPLTDERQNRVEKRLWGERRDIELFQLGLDEYIAALRGRLDFVAALDAPDW